MGYEKRRIDAIGNVNVNDIFYTTMGYNRTMPVFMMVKKVTKRMVTMSRLGEAYRTKYMSNTPGDYMVPAINNMALNAPYIKYEPTDYPYVWDPNRDESVTGYVEEYRSDHMNDYAMHIKAGGNTYFKWDGKPKWVNCD